MIPSLVVTEIRSALVEYPANTFALADDEVHEALSRFLEDKADGIFRGPYLKVRIPVRSIDASWRSPPEWLPDRVQPLRQPGPGIRAALVAGGRIRSRRWSPPSPARARPSASTCSIDLRSTRLVDDGRRQLRDRPS
jgi:hypothetical protein